MDSNTDEDILNDITAETTPNPDVELPKRKRSLLDLLLADHDWYISFDNDSVRQSSIKRHQRFNNVESMVSIPDIEIDESELQRRNERIKKANLKRQETIQRKKHELELRRQLPKPPKPQKKLNMDLKQLIDGASWFNRDFHGDTYTRKVKPKTDRFIDEAVSTVKKHVKKHVKSEVKVKKEVNSRGGSKLDLKAVPVSKLKSTTKPKGKGKPKPKSKPVKENDIDIKEEIQDTEVNKISWFIDNDDMVPINNRQLFISNHEPQSPPTPISASSIIARFQNQYHTNPAPTTIKLVTLFTSYEEEYILVKPKNDELNPFIEIGTVMEMTSFFLPDTERVLIRSDDSIVARYITLYNEDNLPQMINEINTYNSLLKEVKQSDTFYHNLSKITHLPRMVFHNILNQCYARTVSPNVRTLRSYKLFSNEVYGELLPNFLSHIYDQTGLDHTKTFIDLGSGVGNCVLQAALEYGCLAYGCEIMVNASKLCELQTEEFRNRCHIWGIQPGHVTNFLEQSFISNDEVTTVVNKLDIILCNNYLFDLNLNSHCVELFRNLSVGTKIITLKPIVPLGYSFNSMDVESILNRLKVTQYKYENNSVSWTSNGGVYYINEVQGDIVNEYFVVRAKGRTSRTRTPGSRGSRVL